MPIRRSSNRSSSGVPSSGGSRITNVSPACVASKRPLGRRTSPDAGHVAADRELEERDRGPSRRTLANDRDLGPGSPWCRLLTVIAPPLPRTVRRWTRTRALRGSHDHGSGRRPAQARATASAACSVACFSSPAARYASATARAPPCRRQTGAEGLLEGVLGGHDRDRRGTDQARLPRTTSRPRRRRPPARSRTRRRWATRAPRRNSGSPIARRTRATPTYASCPRPRPSAAGRGSGRGWTPLGPRA